MITISPGDNEVVGDRVQDIRGGPAENQADHSDSEEEQGDRGLCCYSNLALNIFFFLFFFFSFSFFVLMESSALIIL